MTDLLQQTILKTAIESIPLLTLDNFSLWRTRIENMLDIQGLQDDLFSDTGTLSETNNIYLRSIITSKLDASVHANIITVENKKEAKLIWKSILNFFASSEASNRSRVFDCLQNLTFNPKDGLGFITSAKVAIRRLHKVGIDLPQDILAYMLIHKLPPSMSNIKDQITHNRDSINPERVLDHVRIYLNNQKPKEDLNLLPSALISTGRSMDSSSLPKCSGGKHNPNNYHSAANFWALHPELKEEYLKRRNGNSTTK